ncbi:MAG TPA: NifU family protein [Candidatus Babeliales bacterium]|nr:NifU family protein [Candidatus Babeliales bacterium]
MTEQPQFELAQQVQKVIAEHIRPKIQLDGGDIELIDIKENIVHIKFQGACVGCPFSFYTLIGGIQATLQEHIPSIKKVIAE